MNLIKKHNKYELLYSLTLLILAGSPIQLMAAENLLKTESGFYYPTNKKHSSSPSYYHGFGDVSPYFNQRCHMANDYKVKEGDPIYAIGEGEIVKEKMDEPYYGGTFGEKGGLIIIKHKTADNKVFYAVYAHIKNFQFAVGDTVEGGKRIADVGPYNGGNNLPFPHLHFAISTDTSALTYKWGYTPTSACTNYMGFVDPEPYMEAHQAPAHDVNTCKANNDHISLIENTITSSGNVLANDTDTNGRLLNIKASDTTSTKGAAITNHNDGTFTYTPIINFTGLDSFKYTITNNQGCTDLATVNVIVNKAQPAILLVADAGNNKQLKCKANYRLIGGAKTSSGAKYHWTTTNGHILADTNKKIAKVDKAGTYTLTVSKTGSKMVADSTVITQETGCDVDTEVMVTLNYQAGTGGTITGAMSQKVKRGASGAAVTAVASSGYSFVKWSDSNTSATRTDSNITANKTLTAQFKKDDVVIITPQPADFDKDGIPDSKDTDDDNDKILDVNDGFPFNASESIDTDKDGMGNNADTDDDNDGFTDAEEKAAGTNPLDAADNPSTDNGDNADNNTSTNEEKTEESSGGNFPIGLLMLGLLALVRRR